MAIMGNKWIEKEASKHSITKTTAPSYDTNSADDFEVPNLKKRIKRYTHAARAVLVRTLRGVRR